MDKLKAIVNQITPITDIELEMILPITKHLTLKKKSFVLEQGQICNHVYFLTKGFFRMYYVDLEGDEKNYRFASENNFLADFQSFLTQKPSNYYWQAMEDSDLLSFSYDDIQSLYMNSKTWERFGRLMAENVYKQLNNRVEMFQYLSPEERYLQLIHLHPEL